MVRFAALAACGASALVFAESAGAARNITLGGGDGFFVSGTQIVCIVVDATRPPLRSLLCALADRRTRKALVRSRWGLITDGDVVVHRAPSEGGTLGASAAILFYHRQPPAPPGASFADVPRHGSGFVLRSGDTVSIGRTHLWCSDVGARLTCTKVSVPTFRPIRGAYAVVISRDSIGVAHTVGKALVPIESWPLIASHS
jgi:hypothetical protein